MRKYGSVNVTLDDKGRRGGARIICVRCEIDGEEILCHTITLGLEGEADLADVIQAQVDRCVIRARKIARADLAAEEFLGQW